MRLIDADELKTAFPCGEYVRTESVRATIDNMPTIEERKTGKWVHDGFDHPHGVDWIHCSVCGRREPNVPAAKTPYCPSCGADMREPEDIPMEYFESGGR